MDTLERLIAFGIPPEERSLPEIRQILLAQIEREQRGQTREDDVAFLCAAQLFAKGLAEDILLIWKAKRSGFDLGSMIDVQMLCGLGIESTRKFLSDIATKEAADALEYLDACLLAGDFEGWSPEVQIMVYRKYFGIE